MKYLHSLAIRVAAIFAIAVVATSCVDNNDNDASDNIAIAFDNRLPEGITRETITNAIVNLKELNTGESFSLNPLSSSMGSVPLGIYDYEGSMTAVVTGPEGETIEKNLRVAGSSVTISENTSLTLNWFFSNPGSSLVFAEIYATGSPNATATGGLRDSYIRIYNNTDETIYADGIGIAESAFVNARTNAFEILTPANDKEVNFTAGTVWVIPGNGTDHPIAPGESIKIVDQAIDWSAQVTGALNHTDADFEWYDDNAQDTNNPSVEDLDKWYCYSLSIWVISNQCNRSYALVKFPAGMTAEDYLSQYHGGYDYIHTIGTHMHNDKAYLIPNEWILDGVNLGNAASYVYGALGKGIDISYASISDVDKDPNRFGKVFRRKTATTEADGRVILQDTNDSRADFELIKL